MNKNLPLKSSHYLGEVSHKSSHKILLSYNIHSHITHFAFSGPIRTFVNYLYEHILEMFSWSLTSLHIASYLIPVSIKHITEIKLTNV